MSKRAREFRATTRRDDRYVEGRAKPEDNDAAVFGWNRAHSRKLTKWVKHQDQMMFVSDDEWVRWLVFKPWIPLIHKGRKPR